MVANRGNNLERDFCRSEAAQACRRIRRRTRFSTACYHASRQVGLQEPAQLLPIPLNTTGRPKAAIGLECCRFVAFQEG